MSLRAEEFPDAAQYARRLGKENLSDLLLRRGMDYARANDIPGLYYRCAERLGLDNVVRFGKLRRIVEAVEKKQYFDAAKSLEEYGLMQRAVEYWRADVNRAKVMASYLSDINHTKKEELLHDPQYGYSQEYIAMLNTVRNGISSAFFNEWKDDVQEIYEVYRNLPKPHHMSVETDMKNSGVRYTKWWLK